MVGCGSQPQPPSDGDPAGTALTPGVLGHLSLDRAGAQSRQMESLLVLAISDRSGDFVGAGTPAPDGRFFVPVLDGSAQVILCVFSDEDGDNTYEALEAVVGYPEAGGSIAYLYGVQHPTPAAAAARQGLGGWDLGSLSIGGIVATAIAVPIAVGNHSTPTNFLDIPVDDEQDDVDVANGNPLGNHDTDGDGITDDLDTDDDNDGYSDDDEERYLTGPDDAIPYVIDDDHDNDGLTNDEDDDDDGDGLQDEEDEEKWGQDLPDYLDDDDDGSPDWEDDDDDNDGIEDVEDEDDDGDGENDWQDIDV